MTPEQWARVKRGFDEVIELDGEARVSWLARVAHEDAEVAREIEAVLHAYEHSGTFLTGPAVIDPLDIVESIDAAPLLEDFSHATLLPGTRVGDYEIQGEVGRGGMGVVYLARDLHLTRLAALKALPAVASRDPVLLERLRREAQAAAAVSHPGVAMVYAFLETERGTFIASEFIQGQTLRQELQRGPVEPARAVRLAIDITQALCAAHDAHVVHRDLKPENVLLTPSGGVKVIDFGIARLERDGMPALTASGMVQGTPGYMAPEQFVSGARPDARVDIYALGVMLAEMVLGVHPYKRSTGAVHTAVQPVTRRCMEADPDRRYRSTRDLLADLERVSRALTADSPPDAFGAPPASSARWWWQFHQGATAVVYWIMAVPAWYARPLLDNVVARAGQFLFFVTLGALLLASILRLHLWFTARVAPGDLPYQFRRERPWILGADGAFAVALVVSGMLIGEEKMSLAVLMLSVGIGAWVVALFIEPTTTRSAFPELDEGRRSAL